MMKSILMFLIALMLAPAMTIQGTTAMADEELAPVTWVGDVPEEYERVVAENRFGGVEASGGRLIRTTVEDDALVIEELNRLGNAQARVALQNVDLGDGSRALGVVATSDGGFLVVSGFIEYQMADRSWASDGGVWSKIVKYNKNGEVEWDYLAENCTGDMLRYAFECVDGYLFFGDAETPSTKRKGVYSPTDIFMMKLDKYGECVGTAVMGGSDYDWISNLIQSDELWILYVIAQSEDGDFAVDENSDAASGCWQIYIDEALGVKDKQPVDWNDMPFDSWPIGMIGGETVYDTDPRFADFDAGYPRLVVDCGDFYLVVSSNATGEYENTPAYISARWYYTEAVYSAYNWSNNLLWRAAVDTSPDYDNMEIE